MALPLASPPEKPDTASSLAKATTASSPEKANVKSLLDKYVKTPEDIRENAISKLKLTGSLEMIMSNQDSPEINMSSQVKDDHKLVRHWLDHGSLRIVGLVQSSQGTKEVFADMSAGDDGFLIAKFPDLPAVTTEISNLMAPPATTATPAKKKRKTQKDTTTQCNEAQGSKHTPEKNAEHAVPKPTPVKISKSTAKEDAKKPAAKEPAE